MRWWTRSIGMSTIGGLAMGAVLAIPGFAQVTGPMKIDQAILAAAIIVLAVGACGYFVGMVWEHKTGFEQQRHSGRDYGLGVLAGAGVCTACWLVLGLVSHLFLH